MKILTETIYQLCFKEFVVQRIQIIT